MRRFGSWIMKWGGPRGADVLIDAPWAGARRDGPGAVGRRFGPSPMTAAWALALAGYFAIFGGLGGLGGVGLAAAEAALPPTPVAPLAVDFQGQGPTRAWVETAAPVPPAQPLVPTVVATAATPADTATADSATPAVAVAPAATAATAAPATVTEPDRSGSSRSAAVLLAHRPVQARTSPAVVPASAAGLGVSAPAGVEVSVVSSSAPVTVSAAPLGPAPISRADFDDPDANDEPPAVEWFGHPSLEAAPTPESIQAEHEANKELLNAKWRLACEYEKIGDFERAIAYCREIHEVDRTNGEVQEKLKSLYRSKAQASVMRADVEREKSNAEVREWIDDLSQAQLPRTFVARPSLEAHFKSALPGANPHQVENLRELLRQRVSYNFVENDLGVVLNYLVSQNNLSIMYNPKDLEGQQVTMRLHDLALEDVLDYLTANYNFAYTYTADHRALMLYKADDPDVAKKFLQTEVIQLRYAPIRSGAIVSSGEGGGEGDAAPAAPTGDDGSGDSPDMSYSIIQQLEWLKKSYAGWPEATTYRFDPNFNTITICSTPKMIREVKRLIAAHDLPPIQVQIIVRFITISQDKLNAFGVDWSGSKVGDDYVQKYKMDDRWAQDIARGEEDSEFKDTWVPLSEAGSGGVSQGIRTITGAMGVAGAESSLKYTGVLFDRLSLDTTLTAIQNNGNGTVLSAPMTLALNNQTATLNLTRAYPYIEDYETESNYSSTDNTASSYTVLRPVFAEEELGTVLTVRPSVGQDMKTINVEVHPKITTPYSTFTYTIPYISDGKATETTHTRPVFATNEVSVRAVLNDGGTLIIGGLVDDTVSETVKKIPGLHRIPVLGKLFQHNSKTRDNNTLLIFVTTNIINQNNERFTDGFAPASRIDDWFKLRNDPEGRARRVGEELGDRPRANRFGGRGK